jgi:hypothetical protein
MSDLRSSLSKVWIALAVLAVGGSAATAAPAQGTSKPPGASPAYTVQRLAEMCVDVDILFGAGIYSSTKLQGWVLMRLITLECPLPMKYALWETDFDSSFLAIRDPEYIASYDKLHEGGIRLGCVVSWRILQKQSPTAADVAKLIVIGQPTLRSWYDDCESTWLSKWFETMSADDTTAIAQQAAKLRILLAEQDFRSKRADLIRAAVKALEADPKTQQQLREALKVSPALVEPRKKLCESLAAASAKLEAQ